MTKKDKREYDKKRYERIRDDRKKEFKEYYQKNREARLLYFREHRNPLVKKKWAMAHPWYASYKSAEARCKNSKNNRFNNYGGRGIKFLMTLEDFEQLWHKNKAYLMECPSIDRIDNNGHYELPNCQFLERRDNTKKQWVDKKKGESYPRATVDESV